MNSLTRALLIFLFVPTVLSSQEINGRFNSSVYTWEKYDTVGSSEMIIRGLQNLQLDIKQGNLSLHTSLFGAMGFTQSFGSNGLLRASRLFLRVKNIGDVADLSIGRIPVFAGVGVGTVDGALAKLWLVDRTVTVTGYGGAYVAPDLQSMHIDGLEKNYVIGGQVAGTLTDDLRMSISYINRNIERQEYTSFRLDSINNPVAFTVMPDSKAEQILGGDLRYSFLNRVTTYARYDYDVNSKRSLRGQLHSRVDATDRLAFTGEFTYREPRIFYNSYFSIFPVTSSKELEGGIEYALCPSIRSYARLAYIRYTDDVSRRLSVGLSTEYGAVGYSGANGYAGQMAVFDVQAMYPLLDRMLIPTVSVSFGTYRQNVALDERQVLFAASVGGVVRPVPEFSADAQVQWLKNPVSENDVRFFVKFNYWFHSTLHLFTGAE